MILWNWFSLTVILILHNLVTGWAFVLPRRDVAISSKIPCRHVVVGDGYRYRRSGRGGAATTPTKTTLHVSGVDAVVIDSVRNLAVAGRIPWKKLLITKQQRQQILSIMRSETHTCDLVAVFILSVFLKKIGKFM
jgi:hypothetical protein